MTLAEIRTATKNLCSISGTSFDTFIDQHINFGQADFSRDINWPFLETIGSLAAVADQYNYDVASNFDTMKSIVYKRLHRLIPVTYEQWILSTENPSSGTPRVYVIHEGNVKMQPATSDVAPTTTLNGAITDAAAVSITLTSTSSLETRGRVIVDDEVIDYQNVSSTQILLCTRGVEGTTAATHSNGATVTAREIEYTYYKALSDLSANGDTSEISTRYHEALVLYASARFFEKVEDTKKADSLLQKYLLIRNQARADLGEKQSQRFSTTLEDSQLRGLYRDETYPNRGSLSGDL